METKNMRNFSKGGKGIVLLLSCLNAQSPMKKPQTLKYHIVKKNIVRI